MGRKSGGRKTGVMGRGKYHHRRQDEASETALGGHSSITMDNTDGPYRTHLLFPGRKDENEAGEARLRLERP